MLRRTAVRTTVMAMMLGGAAGVTHADEGQASTWARLDGYSSTRLLDDRFGAGSVSLGAKAVYELGANDQLRLDGEIRDELRGRDGDVRLVEGLWQHNAGWSDWRIGQQRVSWGKADGINPTDFFTPHDYTLLQPFESDQRRSVLAVRVDVPMGDSLTLSFVGQPLFVETRLPAPAGIALTTRRPPDIPQAGLRLSWSGTAVDWSLCAFHGYVKLPLLDDEIVNGAPSFFFYYPTLDAVGGDIAHNFGRWGFRAEAAWLEPGDQDGVASIRRHGFLVAGADRGEDDWNVNVQALLRVTPGAGHDTPPDPVSAVVMTENMVNYGQLHPVQVGFTTRLAKSWLQQTLQSELLVVGFFQPSTFLLRPLLSYALNDKERLTVGGEVYLGPDASFFGQFKKNSTAFVEYQHFF